MFNVIKAFLTAFPCFEGEINLQIICKAVERKVIECKYWLQGQQWKQDGSQNKN